MKNMSLIGMLVIIATIMTTTVVVIAMWAPNDPAPTSTLTSQLPNGYYLDSISQEEVNIHCGFWEGKIGEEFTLPDGRIGKVIFCYNNAGPVLLLEHNSSSIEEAVKNSEYYLSFGDGWMVAVYPTLDSVQVSWSFSLRSGQSITLLDGTNLTFVKLTKDLPSDTKVIGSVLDDSAMFKW